MPCCISVLMPEPLAPSLSPQGVSCPCPHGLAHAPRPQSPCISTWPPRPQIPCPQVQIARLGDPGSQGPWPRIPTPGQGGGAQDPGLQLPRTPGSQDLTSWILGAGSWVLCPRSEVMGPGPLLLGRVSASLATGLGSQDPQAWLFAPGGMGSEALGGGC